MGFELHLGKDCLGIGKAIKALSEFTGTLIEPKLIVARAKAQKKACELLSDKTTDTSNLPTPLKAEDLSIEERAEITQKHRNVVKQENMETITGYACQELLGDSDVSPEPLDEYWATQFFNRASDVSSEQMQEIWGKILAGEIKRPNTYSLRTLEILSNMTADEAERFAKVSNYVFTYKDAGFVLASESLLDKYEIFFFDFMVLEECGLIKAIRVTLTPEFSDGNIDKFHYGNLSLVLKRSNDNRLYHLPTYPLTQAGLQIYNLFLQQPNKEFFIDALHDLKYSGLVHPSIAGLEISGEEHQKEDEISPLKN